MTLDGARKMLSVLDVRERLIARLALLAGMRPGEIFGLKWARMEADYADIRQRVYRGDVDSPKSTRSVRFAALSDVYPPGTVAGARDPGVPFRFVESVYSIGQWISPHRLHDVNDLIWEPVHDPSSGLYCCVNSFHPAVTSLPNNN